MRRWLAVVSISAGAHLALAALVPYLPRSASDDRRPPPHVVLELIALAPEAPPPSEGTKEIGGDDEKGGDPPPEAPVQAERGLDRGPGDAEAIAEAYALAIAGATRALAAPGAPSPFVLEDGTDAAPPISQMGGTLAGVEQLGHAPARGCPPGAECGTSGARGALDTGLGALASPRRRGHGLAFAGSDPCDGMHICPWQRHRPSGARLVVSVEARGALASHPETGLRRPIVRGAGTCAFEDGPPGPYPFAVSVIGTGAVRAIAKLAPALEGPRQACLAGVLASARFPVSSGDSALLVRITLRR